ncbi:putative Ig domain-containing protein [Pseudoteredinibacter isoporae]|uniref:putative Ig domain-containing protein n=1 Tax=Pseudoteredinibacter isoporae TaxID=570281 RepID=UPI00310936F6
MLSRLKVAVACALCFSSVSHAQTNLDVYELRFAFKADGRPMYEQINVGSAQTRNTFPSEIALSAGTLQKSGQTVWQVTNNSSDTLTNSQSILLLDLEIDQQSNTYFNERVNDVKTDAPPHSDRDGYDSQGFSRWSVDELGYSGGRLDAAYQLFYLDNRNHIASAANDVAVAMQYDLGDLAPGESVFIELHLGDSPVGGFKQVDDDSGDAVNINSVAFTRHAASGGGGSGGGGAGGGGAGGGSGSNVIGVPLPIWMYPLMLLALLSVVRKQKHIVSSVVLLVGLGLASPEYSYAQNPSPSDPLYYEVLESLNRASAYVEEEGARWYLDRDKRCFGCHMHSQSIVGLGTSVGKAAINKDVADYMIGEAIHKQAAGGGLYPNTSSTDPLTQTTLMLWAIDLWPETEQTFPVRERALGFIKPKLLVRSDHAYWGRDDDRGWWATNSTLSAMNISVVVNFIEDSKRYPNMLNDTDLPIYFEALLPKFANYLLGKANETAPNTDNIALSFKMRALAHLAKALPASSLQQQVSQEVLEFKALLVSRQMADGSWKLKEGDAAGDALSTAVVAGTLNELKTNGVVLEDHDRTAIRYLLDSQHKNEQEVALLGSWESEAFKTRISATSLVMGYLPIVIENLVNDASCHIPIRSRSKYGKVQLKWNPRNNARYTLQRKKDLVSEFMDVSDFDASRKTYLDQNVSEGENVYYRLVEYNENGVKICQSQTESAYVPQKISEPGTNMAPYIVSIPNLFAETGTEYRYQIEADDPDGGALAYRLVKGPNSASIDNNGLLSWDVGSRPRQYSFLVEVKDPKGAAVVQEFEVTAESLGQINNIPLIHSTAPVRASIGSTYRYQVNAEDEDGDRLIYVLSGHSAPRDMTINRLTGELSWEPNNLHKEYTFDIRVVDQNGGVGIETVELKVYRGPEFISAPMITAVAGQAYRYQSIAEDLDGKAIQYSLLAGPEGLSIDTSSGEVTWQPTIDKQGKHEVVLLATNSDGGQGEQRYILSVKVGTDFPPIFESNPVTQVQARKSYRYNIVVRDPEGAYVSVKLENPLDGMVMYNDQYVSTYHSPFISWVPKQKDYGKSFPVKLIATDPAGNTSTQSWEIEVWPPTYSSEPYAYTTPPGSIRAESTWTYFVGVTDPDSDTPYTLSLASSPAGVSLDNNIVRWVPTESQVGKHTIAVDIEDNTGAKGKHEFTITVYPKKYNLPPYINTIPKTQIQFGEEFVYRPGAIDPDGDELQISVNASEPGFTVDADKKIIRWTAPNVEKDVTVDLEISDGFGGKVAQRFVLLVRADSGTPNRPPYILSSPGTSVLAGRSYGYQMRASDREDSSLFYRLDTAPAGMEINGNLISWIPNENDEGEHTVDIVVSDSAGAEARQSFQLNVEVRNRKPFFNSSFPIPVLGREFHHRVHARDYDGDPVTIELVAAPAGMTIDAAGIVKWTPVVGDHLVHIRISDPKGASDEKKVRFSLKEPNRKPVFNIPLPRNATIGVPYEYTPNVTDADGDDIKLSIGMIPKNVQYDSLTGKISFLPSVEHLPYVAYRYRATDEHGAYSEIAGFIYVRSPHGNSAPNFVSTPQQNITIGESWSYRAEAVDPDGDPIQYRFSKAPLGMIIDNQSGLVSWPSATAGTHSIQITAIDNNGGSKTQSFKLFVSGTLGGESPPFVNVATSHLIQLNTDWYLNLNSADPDGDTISHQLLLAPEGFNLNSATGEINWRPEEVGNYLATIQLSDGSHKTDIQLEMEVTEQAVNYAPRFTSVPVKQAAVGSAYNYTAQAVDDNGDEIEYKLLRGPVGLRVHAVSGEFTWVPNAGQLGKHRVIVSANDGEHSTLQGFSITTTGSGNGTGGDGLSLSLPLAKHQLDANEEMVLRPQVSNVSGSLQSLTLSINGESKTLAADNSFTFSSDQPGRYAITVVAKDDDEEISIEEVIFVQDPSDQQAPAIEFHNPVDGIEMATIKEPIDVIVSVQDDNALTWTLHLKDLSDRNAEPELLFEGSGNLDKATVGKLDPTLRENGIYSLTLSAEDESGNGTAIETHVNLDGDMKLGQFSLSFSDVNIDTVGIPLLATRSYDSRARNSNGDFGHGWKLDYSYIRISENGVLGRKWLLEESGFGLNRKFCFNPNGDRNVSITTPDGENHSFKAVAVPACSSIASNPHATFSLEYKAINGSTSTLEQLDYGTVRVRTQGGRTGVYELGGVEPINPRNYKLTTKEGVEYVLDQNFGIRKVTTAEGHSLDFTDFGIEHSQGLNLEIKRDNQGRVTKITKPDGETLEYRYDSAGNLASSIDENGNISHYTYYDGKLKHYLKEVFDPLGNRASRMEYSDDGRLEAQIDAQGNRTEFSHNVSGRTSQVKDRNGNISTYVYDINGNVLAETNGEGETTTRAYDQEDNEIRREDALGNVMAYSYDVNGNVLTETNALGDTTTMSYSGQQLTKEVNPLGETVEFTYKNDARGVATRAITSATDGDGSKLTVGYDCNYGAVLNVQDAEGYTRNFTINCRTGQTTIETDAEGVSRRLHKNKSGHLLGEEVDWTDENGNSQKLKTNYTVDAKGNRTATEYPNGSKTKARYNSVDQMISATDALGRETRYQYDKRGNQTQVRYPDGSQELKQYDAEGNLIAETDANGNTTRYVYDKANRQIETRYADGSVIKNEYLDNGWLAATVDARGAKTQYRYDKAGRRTQIIDALGNTMRYEYDKAGRKVAAVDARGNRTAYEYDKADRLIKTTFADGTSIGQRYLKNGWKKSSTDQLGRVTHYGYDKNGRLISVTDAAGGITRYSYDELGNKLTQTDAEGRVTRWAYDEMGRVIKRILPMGQFETMAYDATGNMISHTDFNGQLSTYEYDNRDRRIQASYADGRIEEWSYDSNGNTVSHSINLDGTTRTTAFEYDARNRVIKETLPNSKVLEYQYDVAGNRTQLKETVNTETNITRFTFDVLNRLANTIDSNGTTANEYDAVGNKSKETKPNGNTVHYVYDNVNRLTQLRHEDSSNVVLKQRDYSLDATGRRVRIEEPSGRTRSYSYDSLYRLVDETILDSANGDYRSEFQYDKVGNRIQSVINGVTTAYQYDSNDRLLKQGGTVYTYDDNGSILTETLDGNVTRYEYNAKNELVKLTKAGTITTYQYDIDGIRSAKTENGVTTEFLVDKNRDYAQVLAEVVNGSVTTRYTYGDDLLSKTQNSQTHYYHYDGLGSTIALSNSAGAITDTYGYNAFGEVLFRTGSTENRYTFTGEQYDPTLGQFYLRARYYSQSAGRFTQMDTWMGNSQDPITLHKYLYANADPGNMVDPSGNFSIGSVMSAVGNMARLASSVINAYSNAQTLINIAQGEMTASEIAFSLFASKFYRKKILNCNSFEEGTSVLTDSGLKSIEDISVGDGVWSFNVKTGKREINLVDHFIVGSGLKQIVEITLSSGNTIVTTEDHRFFLADSKNWMVASKLKVGDELKDLNDSSVKISGLRKYSEEKVVYNLTINKLHNYYVGRDSVLSHNMGPCKKPEVSWDHILRGNFNKRRQFGGWHHNPQGLTPKDRGLLSINPGPGGFYTAKVYGVNGAGKYKKKGANDGVSTFFPDSWSSEVVKSTILAAYKATGGKGGIVPVKNIIPYGPKGVHIKVVVRGNEILTAYPIIK